MRTKQIHASVVKDGKVRYLCNQACSISVDRVTNDYSKVTCQNCKNILKKENPKKELKKQMLIKKTDLLKIELKRYKDVLIKYGFVEICTGSVFFEKLFNEKLLAGVDVIHKSGLSQKKQNEMLEELYFGPRDKSVEEFNYDYTKRMISWAKRNLSNLSDKIKKQIIDDSLGFQDAWSQQFNKTDELYKKLKELK